MLAGSMRRLRAVSSRPLEPLLVAILLLLLTVAAMHAALPLFARAERHSMNAALHEMRRGLMLAAVVALTRGDQQGLAALEHANPVESSPVPPARYAGEHADGEALRVYRAHWYFDPVQRLLGYRVSAEEAFEGGADDPPRARFRVGLRYLDADGDGGFTPGADVFTGIDLVAVEPWRWR